MARNYYFLVAGLPNITIEDSKLSYGSAEMLSDMKEFLHKKDYSYFELFRLKQDNRNLYKILCGFDVKAFESGNYTRAQIEQMIEEPDEAVSYIREFIEAFEKDIEKRDELKQKLVTSYIDHLLECDNEFLKSYFELEINMRNILAALNVRKHGLDAEKYILKINEVSSALKSSSLKDFGLSDSVEYIDRLSSIFEIKDLLAREKAIDLFKWDWLDEKTVWNYFTIEKLLVHFIKVTIIERWIKLDPETGKELFERFIRELEKQGKESGITDEEKEKNRIEG
ncbi:MAG TPA: DUF2764 family protein [Clostridiales bacterium]|nr:DUF2764 family protein [Clostridiales bacterium]HQP70445.1 DUF2764 family protein [Clostridiales bacterium]